MKNLLRLTLVSLLALFCGTTFAQTTFDFNNEYATLFPTLTGTSDSNGSTAGDFTEATTSTAIDGITVTVSAKSSGNNENRIWTSTPRLRMYSGTLTVTAPTGKNITSIEFDCGRWNSNNSVEVGELTVSGSDATWTGTANSIVVSIAGNTQMNALTVYIDGETPEPVATVKYEKATSVESGKQYLIVADEDGTLHVAQPVTSNYGYLQVENYTAASDGTIEIAEDAGCDFVIAETTGGYTIMQQDSRYLYQKETHNSFNVDAVPSDGHVWSIAANADGTFTITNTSVNKYVQYSTKYSSFGSYASEQSNSILPCLYVKKDVSTGITNMTVNKNTLDENAPIYNISGQRVSKDAKGILIQNGKKFIK